MSVRERPPRERDLPQLDAEEEVDLGRAWGRIAARWWLPVLGLVLGALIGYALSAGGGGKTYRATATVYPGITITPGGGVVQTGGTDPTTVRTIVTSEAAIKAAAARAGLRPGQLRGRISSAPVGGATALRRTATPGTQLVRISVLGGQRAKVGVAANALATIVTDQLSRLVDRKIATYQAQLEAQSESLTRAQQRIAAAEAALRQPGLGTLERFFLIASIDNAEQRRAQVVQQRTQTQQLIAFGEDVERAQIVTRASPVETTARSRRNSLLVGALLGLILGTLAALTSDALASRFGRRPAL